MMYGKYAVTVGKDGRFFVPASMSKQFEGTENYCVCVSREANTASGTFLIYKFGGEVCPEETLIKTYKVLSDKTLKVPPKYREEMSGRCYLIGVGSDIELHKADFFDSCEMPDLEAMVKGLGLEDLKL